MNKMNKKGFTLIEMLVVIAIIAVLVSIIVPVVGNSTAKAAAATNAANLRSVAASIAIKYLDGTIPGDTTSLTKTQVEGYGITVPDAKDVTGITKGDFAATIDDGNVTCSFGTDGTIEHYANIAAGLNKDGTAKS